MGNKDLYELSAEYNDYDDYEDIFDDEDEVKPESVVYVPYIPEYNLGDIGLGMEIPVSNSDFIYLDKPTVRISDNRTINTERPNIRPKQTVQKLPQQRIDYINKKRTDTDYIKNIPQPTQEIVMKPKKKETAKKEIDYQKIADILYPTMSEKSQIKNTQRYKLLDDTPKQNKKVFMNYEPMTLLGDSNYKAVNLYEKEKLQKENEILKKALEYEIKMKNRADILYPTMQDKTDDAFKGGIERQTQPQEKHSFWNEIAVDHINNSALKEAATKLFGLETAENLLMSKKDTYLNTDYTKEHLIFKNYKELNTDLRNYFEKKITKEIGSDKLEHTGGIYINAEHQSSKRLAKALVNNQEFIKKVAQKRKSLEVGNSVDTSIQFTDNNFHNAIGKADILDMHINKTGNLDLLVTDVYDFNDDKNASDLIKVGRDRQEKGEIIPYFFIYHVIIPKNAKLGKSEKK